MRLQSRFSCAIPRPRNPYAALYLVAMIGLAGPFILKRASELDICFMPTSQLLLSGGDIYTQSHGYVYPPFQSLLAVPLTPLPHLAQRTVFFLANAIALWIALRSAWRLAGGKDFERVPPTRREQIACALGFIVGMVYFLNSLMHHQTDVLLAALLFAGCERIEYGRGFGAATLIGLAAAMKCTPLLFMIYFLVRGRLLASAWLLCVAVLASLLPDLIHGPSGASTWLTKWWGTFIVPMAGENHRPGVWASDIIFNQSLVGAVNRWSMTGWGFNPGFQAYLIEPLLSPAGMKAIILALAALLGGASLIRMNRQFGVDCAMVICGMLLFSPMSSPAHFGVLVLPAFLLARAAQIDRSTTAMSFLIALLMLGLCVNKDLLGASLYSFGLWHGSVMFAAVIALIGCWCLPTKSG